MGLIIDVGGGGSGTATAIETVPSFSDLPDPAIAGVGAVRVTEDTGVFYVSDGTTWNAVAGGGSIVGGTNVGTGTGLVFKDVSGANLRFRSILVDSSINLTNNTNDVSLSVASAPNVTGVVAIANGGTGQSNQQAGLNNITGAGAATDGDVLQYLGGNAQFAPFTTSVTYAQINAALALPADSFMFSNATSEVVGYSDWHLDPDTHFSNVDIFDHPDNLGTNAQIHNWNVNVDPLQNSPDDSLVLHSLGINLDSAATGFTYGSNGQAAVLLSGSYNYGGNGAVIGTLRNLNFFSGFGDGTNPGTIKGCVANSHAYNFSANMTIDGGITGYDFNVAVNAAAITTSNFQILWISDFSNIPNDVYGYQGLVCQPNIATIKNNHNFGGVGVAPNVVTMEGNAGFFANSVGGSITTLGTGGYQAYSANTNITTVPATSYLQCFSSFHQIGTMAATSNYHGGSISPTVTTLHGDLTAYEAFPQVTGGDGNVKLFIGSMGGITTTGNIDVLSLNGTTANGGQSGFSADGVRMNIGGRLDALSGQVIQSQHVIFTEYHTPASTVITGTDILMNIFSPDVDFGDATSEVDLGPSGLGVSMVGFAGQMHGHGKMDLLNSLLCGAIFAEDFVLNEFRDINSVMINAGYTGTTTKATAFYHEVGGAGLFATTHWGLRVVTDGVENFVQRLAVGGTTQVVTNASVGIEVGATDKALLVSRLTSAQESALTAVNGMIIYNTDTNKFRGYENGAWADMI